MKNTKRKPQINFEAKKEFIDELKQVAEIIEIPAAQIIRDAVRKQVAELKRTDPRLKNLSAQVHIN